MVPLLLARKTLLRGAKTNSRGDTTSRFRATEWNIATIAAWTEEDRNGVVPFPMPFGTSILAWGRLRTPPDE